MANQNKAQELQQIDNVTSEQNVMPGYGTKQPTTWHMILFAIWVGLLGWLADFDSAFGGIVLLMEPYKQAFGTCQTTIGSNGAPVQSCSITATQQSLIQLTVLFSAVGGLLSGPVGTYFGRRPTVQMGCLLVVIGAAGMVGSQGSFLNYMVCKCIGGVGIGLLYSAAPTWGSEAIAPSKRGFLMCLYNIGLASGNVAAAAICVGSSKFSTNWSWRTPIICQIPAGLLLGVASFCFHESPRWLLLQGQDDRARRSFASLYRKDAASDDISWQVEDVCRHIELEREMVRTTSWTEIFTGINGKRTHIAVLILLGNALCGIFFVIPYTALFLSNIGLTNPYTLNVAVSSCVLAGTVPGPFLCEYVGRRLSLIGGYIIMAMSMLIAAAVSTGLGQSDTTAQHVLIAFLCIWAFTFGATSGPIVWVASAEMHSLRLRTIGQAYAVGIYQVFSFGGAFWTPYMLNPSYGNMGTNVGYFYFGITVVIIALTFLFVPESGRLSLEQIDQQFLRGTPAWQTSLKENKAIAASQTGEIASIKL